MTEEEVSNPAEEAPEGAVQETPDNEPEDDSDLHWLQKLLDNPWLAASTWICCPVPQLHSVGMG